MSNPLSPHLQVYRWQITSVLSILHRITGVVSSLGSLIIIFLGIYIFDRKKIWLIIVNYFEADIDIILYNAISFI